VSELTTDTNLANPLSVDPSAGRILPSLRHRTFSGLIWIVIQTLASKALTVVTQTALAFFLAKSVFGEVALVYLAASFVSVLQNSGLREILVQRQLRFNQWVTPAFWMALVIGIAGCILTIGAAPIAALVFQDRGLILPIMVVAAAVPFDTVGMIPLARLQVGLRFKALAILGSFSQLITTALSIFLAWRGFGIYSFVIPRPIGSIVQMALYWAFSGVELRPKPRLSRCRFLFGNSALMMATTFFSVVIAQGDYLMLGLFGSKAALGVYFFAFGLSAQSLQVVSGNLTNVLFPALSHLDSDRKRQTLGCIRACRLLAYVGVLLCFLQAALAGPLLTLIYRGKWDDAIPVFEILSLGMAMIIASPPASSLILAQGRFSFFFFWTASLSAVFLAAACTGAKLGGAVSVATAVCAYYVIFGPLGVYVAIRPGGGTWKDVAAVYLKPLLFSCLAAGGAVAIAKAAVLAVHPLFAAVEIVIFVTIAYIILMALFAPKDVREIRTLFRPFVSKILGTK